MPANRAGVQGPIQAASHPDPFQGAKRTARAALGVVTWVTFLILAATPGIAHGNGGGTEIFRGQQGLYEVVVAVQPGQPEVGSLHLSIEPREAASSLPVTDAEIIIIARQASGETAYQVRALNTPDSPLSYEANITFELPGTWTVQVDIHSDRLGDAAVVFPLEVKQRRLTPSSAGGFVLLGAILVVLGIGAYIWYSARRQLRAR